jgi:hypothetical protein
VGKNELSRSEVDSLKDAVDKVSQEESFDEKDSEGNPVELEELISDKSEMEKPDGEDATRFKRAPFNFKVGYETMLQHYTSAHEVEDKVFSVLGPPPSEMDRPERKKFKTEASFKEAELRYFKRRSHRLGIRCARLENQIRDLKNLQDGMRANIRREFQFLKDKEREDAVKCDIRWVKITGELSRKQSELNLCSGYKKEAEGKYQQRSRGIELWKAQQQR